MGMDLEPLTPENIFHLIKILNKSENFISILDEFFLYWRKFFIFDNMVIYNFDVDYCLTAFFAKAIGRGKDQGPDISWGEKIANQIIEQSEDYYVDNFPPFENKDRLDQPYYLGIPIKDNEQFLGVIIFIRFGSPPYNQTECQLGSLVTRMLLPLFIHQSIDQHYAALEREKFIVKSSEDLIPTISRAIRTPLGGIKGYTTTLLRSDISWDKASEQEFLRIIDDETDYLIQFIENLLDSARLSTGLSKMNFLPIPIDDVLREAIGHIHLSNPTVIINFDCPDSLDHIQGDQNRLNQVFLQIFKNAIQYAPNSDIWVKIKQNQTTTTITLRDYGPGIAEKYLPFIFDRFYKCPENSPTIHGSGLGLYICQQIVLAHQGQISAESQLGRGVTILISLPNQQ